MLMTQQAARQGSDRSRPDDRMQADDAQSLATSSTDDNEDRDDVIAVEDLNMVESGVDDCLVTSLRAEVNH